MENEIIKSVAEADKAVAQMAATVAPTKNTDTKKKRVRRVISPVWRVMKSGNRKFNAQLSIFQNTETKWECLNESASKFYSDRGDFWADFRTQAARLVDSKRFEKCCRDNRLDVQAVAEHVAFEGNAMVNRVIRNGLEVTFGERIMMYQRPIYRDDANLYQQAGGARDGENQQDV